MARISRFLPWLLVLVLTLTGFFTCYILSSWWPLPHTISQKIGLAQFVIETGGFSAVAHFVEVEIIFADKDLFIKPPGRAGSLHWPILLNSSPNKKYWEYKDLENGRQFIFEGKDEYICHPERKRILGSFKLSIEVEEQYSGSPYKVKYTIYADRMTPVTGVFDFCVIEPAEVT